MPFLPDVNVLLAARRADHPAHESAMAWLRDAMAGTEPIIVPHVVWSGFLRLATSSRLWNDPDPPNEAWEFVSALRGTSIVRDLTAGDVVLSRFGEMCQASRATGNLVPDVYLAACAAEVAATVVTFDRDFRRLDGVSLLELSD